MPSLRPTAILDYVSTVTQAEVSIRAPEQPAVL